MANPPDPEDLKLLVRVLRAFRQWDQLKLAEAAGMDPSSISHYETGRTVPPRKSLESLAAAVGVPMSFVEGSLLPVLATGRAAAAPFSSDEFGGMEADLEQTLVGAARSTLSIFISSLDSADESLWGRTGAPVPEDRSVAADLWARLKIRSAEERLYLVESCREFQVWSLAERLCHESEEAASDRADRALELARLAHRVAELGPEGGWRSRVEGYALGYLANAQRVSGDLPRAEETFVRAWRLWELGAGAEPGLLAEWRLLDLETSLHRDLRRFGNALEGLDRVLAVAPAEVTGRILTKKAFTLEQMGEAEQALEALREAAPFLDEKHEPRLLFGLRFNTVANLCHLGRFSEAEALLPDLRELAATMKKELDLIRIVWLKGRVMAGLGRGEEARVAFEETRRELTTREIAYDCALVTLELAVLLLNQGQAREVRTLAEEMLWIFRAQGVHREALAALKVFCGAVRREAATVELARRVALFLQNAQHDPGLRFEE
jgi:transcriptional regulator with XRE-family HTH domain